MRTIFILCFIINTLQANAQCHSYFNLSRVNYWEFEKRDGNDKKLGKEVHQLTRMDGKEGTIVILSYNNKGISQGKYEYPVSCDDGNIAFNMRRYVPRVTSILFPNGNVAAEGDRIIWPSDLAPDMTFEDGTAELTGKVNLPSKVLLTVKNRKTEKEEKISTPAGDFDCLIISYEIESKSLVLTQQKKIEWWSEGLGMVKQDTYEKGKLKYSLILASHE
ncbi:MAG TPA: hypothetical protein ACFCUD_06210 [Cyclobacteriaceae bacterium]